MDGGFAHILCNWALTEGEESTYPPRRWLSEAGCDAFILHFGTQEPMAYAAIWNAPLKARDPSAFVAAVDRWLDYYQERDIHALCSGAVIARRRPAGERPWLRTLSLPRLPEDSAGDDLLRLFQNEDWLQAGGSDQRLLDSTFSLLDRHEVRQVLTYRGGVYDSHRCAVARTSGFRVEVGVDPEALQVVLRLDGSHTLRDIAHQVASDLGLDGTALVHKAVAAARELLRNGLIFPRETVDLRAATV